MLGAEETQQARSISSNVPSSVTAARPAVVVGQQTVRTTETASVVKSGSSQHHRPAAGGVPVRAVAPGIGILQRPIRPTQVEPSRPDVYPSLMASAAASKQQQQVPYRPPPPHRLLFFFYFDIVELFVFWCCL